jgi:hypothetical protein
MPFASAFHRFAIALVFGNVRFHAAIPQELSRCTGIKATIRIEYGTGVVQSAALQVIEYIFEFLFELIAVVVVAGNDTSRGNNRAVRVGYW